MSADTAVRTTFPDERKKIPGTAYWLPEVAKVTFELRKNNRFDATDAYVVMTSIDIGNESDLVIFPEDDWIPPIDEPVYVYLRQGNRSAKAAPINPKDAFYHGMQAYKKISELEDRVKELEIRNPVAHQSIVESIESNSEPSEDIAETTSEE